MAKAPILTPRADDFPQWYQDVVAKAALAESGPARGTVTVNRWEPSARPVGTVQTSASPSTPKPAKTPPAPCLSSCSS